MADNNLQSNEQKSFADKLSDKANELKNKAADALDKVEDRAEEV